MPILMRRMPHQREEAKRIRAVCDSLTSTEEELYETDGGVPGLIIGAAAAGVAVFGLGVYNGYMDTKDAKPALKSQKKKK